MPKIRDLGINVIPETMRPPEVGPGGGCGILTLVGTSPQAGQCPNPTQPGVDCFPNYNACQGPCSAASPATSPFCGSGIPCARSAASECCAQNYPVPEAQQCGPVSITAQTSPYVPGCFGTGGTNPFSYTCPSYCCPTAAGGLTREAVAQLKDQLRQQLDALTEYEKSLGPKTREAIDAREKELQAELEDLGRRRQQLNEKEKE